jgi:DNA-binding CsgD family transcriptional regulator
VKRDRRDRSPSKTSLSFPNSRRELYFFCETKTGVSRFHVKAGPDGQFPVEEAAGLLAMHCMVRGQSPADYVVMVEAAHEAWANLAEKTESLLQAGYSVPHSVKITCREEEVLAGVMRSKTNKEIAVSLNMCERTVKFHVSSLLSKFHVHGRMALAFKAANHSLGAIMAEPLASRAARGFAQAPSYHNASRLGPIAIASVPGRAGPTCVPEEASAHRLRPA